MKKSKKTESRKLFDWIQLFWSFLAIFESILYINIQQKSVQVNRKEIEIVQNQSKRDQKGLQMEFDNTILTIKFGIIIKSPSKFR